MPAESFHLHKITVTTSARLHLGFIDLNGSQGRLFGSLGLALDAPTTQITIVKNKKTLITGKSCDHVSKILENIKNKLNIKQHFSVDIVQSMPQHAGLGSGTQMALALAAGINQLCDLKVSIAQLANFTNRGNRSGIGIGTFESGGLVLDGGKKIQHRIKQEQPNVPPVIARHDFPMQWPILLIIDQSDKGVFGDAELLAFDTLASSDFATAQALSHHVLMRALPAIVEQDYAEFSKAINALQLATGSYFSAAQGGHYKSQAVAEVLAYLNAHGNVCIGQSSWGPTGFVIFENDDVADKMLNQLQLQFSKQSNISFQLVRAKNTGATIQID